MCLPTYHTLPQIDSTSVFIFPTVQLFSTLLVPRSKQWYQRRVRETIQAKQMRILLVLFVLLPTLQTYAKGNAEPRLSLPSGKPPTSETNVLPPQNFSFSPKPLPVSTPVSRTPQPSPKRKIADIVKSISALSVFEINQALDTESTIHTRVSHFFLETGSTNRFLFFLQEDPTPEAPTFMSALTNVLANLSHTTPNRFNVSLYFSNGTALLNPPRTQKELDTTGCYYALVMVINVPKPNIALYIIVGIITLVALIVVIVFVISANRNRHDFQNLIDRLFIT
eukprot:TRINITY_DN4733_c0_g1_i2.p1 TRINITY_DN4733_c0_g1~~TRINITY_DN4733_c0_g1_i2.p1  ORF type:complete len:281 (-),score=33.18 TRINITY_DN4733_c0_g1_i2:23-865(-)